jgi:glycosyltransferase involved in cell wall biosynthesis
VVVPAWDEEETVGEVVGRIRAAGLPVLVVDDGSSDATAERAEQAGGRVLRLPINLGVGGALRAGFRYAVRSGFDVVVVCDADGQHRPEQIGRLLEAMERTDADLVLGSRFAEDRGYPKGVRGRAMRVLAAVTRRNCGVTVTDATSGFRAVRRPLLEMFAAQYPHEYLGDTVESLILAGRAGYRIVEDPVNIDARSSGPSSASDLAAAWFTVRVLVAVALRSRGGPRSRDPERNRAATERASATS